MGCLESIFGIVFGIIGVVLGLIGAIIGIVLGVIGLVIALVIGLVLGIIVIVLLPLALPILLLGAALVTIARRRLRDWEWLPFVEKPRVRTSWITGLIIVVVASVPLTLYGPRLLDRIMLWALP